MEAPNYHIPVLLHDTVAGLNIDPNGVYVDVTFGGGGHSREILSQLENGRLFAFDQDPDAAQNAPDDERFTLIPQNFRHLQNYLRFYGVKEVDGILADLGVSSHQFDVPDRGFSIRFDAPLDMRMNPAAKLHAGEIVNTWPEEQLRDLFKRYGELRNAGRAAKRLVELRAEAPINTTFELIKALNPLAPHSKEHKFHAQVFQALRITVNEEMEALEALLEQGMKLLKPGGRFSVLSYHSLEDRMVKYFFRAGKLDGEVEKDFFGKHLTPFKQIVKGEAATEEEKARNPRARSARLRVAEKK